MTSPQNDNTLLVEQDAPEGKILSDADIQILTEARTASWRLEQYEFAYDFDVRTLSWIQTVLDFLSVVVAILFIFLQVAVPDANVNLEWQVGIIGTGLLLLVILATIWANMAQWKTRIEKMQLLSTNTRQLLKAYEKAIISRPVNHSVIRDWLMEVIDYDEQRKEPLVTVSTLAMKRGFQHLGKRYMGRGVVCSACNQEWTHESNKRSRWSWLPFYGCSECGV